MYLHFHGATASNSRLQRSVSVSFESFGHAFSLYGRVSHNVFSDSFFIVKASTSALAPPQFQRAKVYTFTVKTFSSRSETKVFYSPTNFADLLPVSEYDTARDLYQHCAFPVFDAAKLMSGTVKQYWAKGLLFASSPPGTKQLFSGIIVLHSLVSPITIFLADRQRFFPIANGSVFEGFVKLNEFRGLTSLSANCPFNLSKPSNSLEMGGPLREAFPMSLQAALAQVQNKPVYQDSESEEKDNASSLAPGGRGAFIHLVIDILHEVDDSNYADTIACYVCEECDKDEEKCKCNAPKYIPGFMPHVVCKASSANDEKEFCARLKPAVSTTILRKSGAQICEPFFSFHGSTDDGRHLINSVVQEMSCRAFVSMAINFAKNNLYFTIYKAIVIQYFHASSSSSSSSSSQNPPPLSSSPSLIVETQGRGALHAHLHTSASPSSSSSSRPRSPSPSPSS